MIVELKRASVNINSHRLTEQVEKYQEALKKCLAKSHKEFGGGAENVDVVCILGDVPSNWKNKSAPSRSRAQENLWITANIRIITYEALIHEAMNRYSDLIKVQEKHGHLQRIYELALGEKN